MLVSDVICEGGFLSIDIGIVAMDGGWGGIGNLLPVTDAAVLMADGFFTAGFTGVCFLENGFLNK